MIEGWAAAMGSFITRSFNWITGGSFNQPFSARIYDIAHRSEQSEWAWRIVGAIDWAFGDDEHCFNQWLYYQ